MSQAAARKDIQKLQRAIVDGLEHIKARDIRAYDTAHLSPLFERVLIASGASNRQSRAIAASVRDKVRAAGFSRPRLEGEENGEWIIIDCGAAVAHVMQPAIRQYYRLEEIWGDKPVRLKIGAPKPAAPAPVVKKTAAKSPAQKTAAKTAAKKTPAPKTVAVKTATSSKTAVGKDKSDGSRTRSPIAETSKTSAKKSAAPAPARRTTRAAAAKVAGKNATPKSAAKVPAKKTAARKTQARKTT